MYDSIEVECWIDGGCNPNPGPAGIGYIIKNKINNNLIIEEYKSIGRATNNIAEYNALILCINKIEEINSNGIKISHALINTDSELIYRQLTCFKCGKQNCKGKSLYRTRNKALKTLNMKAKELIINSTIDYRLRQIPRELNGDADSLATHGVDGNA